MLRLILFIHLAVLVVLLLLIYIFKIDSLLSSFVIKLEELLFLSFFLK